MSSKIDELKFDIKELNSFLKQAWRERTKDVLTLEIRRLQTELARLLAENKNVSIKPTTPLLNGPQKCYTVKLNNYGWDQTLTIVKIYVTLKDVHRLPKDNIICNFTDKSLDLRLLDLDNKNYNLTINNLCSEIDTEKSSFKVKTDMIVMFLAKKVAKDWSHITLVEKRIKDAKSSTVPELGEDSDPGASLMNLMKKMYQNGDDEMKKIIAKAWTESEGKQISDIIVLFSLVLEKRIKNARSSIVEWLRELDVDSDPCVNMMNLMKKMYQNGDDEMKKIIAKAWTESEGKQISDIIELFSQFRST